MPVDVEFDVPEVELRMNACDDGFVWFEIYFAAFHELQSASSETNFIMK